MTVVQPAAQATAKFRATAFAQYIASLAVAKGDPMHAERIFTDRHPRSMFIDAVQKAAVTAATTNDPVWAGPLAPLDPLGSAFIEYLRPRSILGQMSGFRRVPLDIRVPRATAGASVGWVGQGKATAVSTMAFEGIIFERSKVAGLIAITKELAQHSSPDADSVIRDELAGSVAAFTDSSFLDPSLDEVADLRPASITFGAPNIAATGNTAASARADLSALIKLIETNLNGLFLIMRPRTAINLAATGDPTFEKVGARGGEIFGVPVITGNVPADANSPSDNLIVAVDAAEVFMHEGGIEFDASEQATIELSSTPDSPAASSTVLTSLWQNNLIALKVVRYLRWKVARNGAAAYLRGVTY